MRQYIWWVLGSIFGVFALLFVLIGIPVLRHAGDSINPPDVFLHQTAVERAKSPECIAKQAKAIQEEEPIRAAQNAVNARQNQIVSLVALSVPDNYKGPAKIPPQYQPEYDNLAKQYAALGDQIDAIEMKYACN